MPSGEGNAENSKKTTLGLISKKETLQVQHSFFVHFFPVVCTSTTWNYQKLPSYTFYGGNVVLVSCSLFFFHYRSYLPWWPLAFLSFSPPLQNFYVVLPTKKVSFLFYLSLWLSVGLFLVELHWPVTYILFFFVFLFIYIPNLWTWNN